MTWEDVLAFTVLGLIIFCGYLWGSTMSRRIKARAEQGDPKAQYELSQLYGDGLPWGSESKVPLGDIKQNYVTAYAWAIISESNQNCISTYDFDFPDYKERLENKLRTKIGQLGVDEAKKLAIEMVHENPKLIGD